MKETAQRVAVATLIVFAIVAVALALWKLKLVLALVFLAFILAAALRPSIERLARPGIPRGFGPLIHYLVLAGVLALALWIVGGFAVVLAVPLVAVIVTVLDVVVRDVDPAEEDVPTVLFPVKDAET